LARQLIVDTPNNLIAIQYLAISLAQQGQTKEAIDQFNKILTLNENVPEVHNSIGHALMLQQDFADALTHFQKAADLDPRNPTYLRHLGNAFFELKRYQEAVDCFRETVESYKEDSLFLYNYGTALNEISDWDTATSVLEHAIRINPRDADMFNNLGLSYLGKMDFQAALKNFDQALKLKPDSIKALFNKGRALISLSRLPEAMICFSNILKIEPNNILAINALGNCNLSRKRISKAITQFQKVLTLEPNSETALNNLGNCYLKQGDLDKSITYFERALSLNKNYENAIVGLGKCFSERGQHSKALSYFRQAMDVEEPSPSLISRTVMEERFLCDWGHYQESEEVLNRANTKRNFPIFPFVFLSYSDDYQASLECADDFQSNVFKFIEPFKPVLPSSRRSNERLKVAYLSADYREHAVAYHVAELFECHDRQRFEVHGISFGPRSDSAVRRRIEAAFDTFHDVQDKSDFEIATFLRDEKIDIAVDLMGYTRDNRVGALAYRPAPIQVSYLGYPGTLGAKFMDYILVDRFVAPPETQPFFTEKLVHLPNSYQANDRKRKIAEPTPSRRDCGLPEKGFVFCCFNSSYKITPFVFDVWMRILHQVEGSVFWLFASNPEAQENLLHEAALRGIGEDRLVFAPRLPLEKHLGRHRCADLFLDTLPYNAHGTASHALWAGLPLLTCAGNSFQSRVGQSLLNAVDLPELVTTSLEDYETLAVKLAKEPRLLQTYRRRLLDSQKTAPLFDTDRFTNNLERAFEVMWERWRSGECPTPIEIKE
jgi:predicted O-linked N-acetylglucosamine transferase (SPINDLY family)